jgi:cytoskeletal protein RodZ
MEIGARLKEAREAKNISLESLQESTKIQKRYLMAIEEGNMKILPGKFYARAFIKEYANAVGLDPDELLEEYKEEVPKTEEQEEVKYTRMQRTRKSGNTDKSSSHSSILPTIITVILVIGILFAAWYFIKQSMGNDESNAPSEEEDIIITNPENSQENASGNEDNESNEDESTTDDADQEETNEQEQEENQPEPSFSVVEEGTGSTPVSTVALDNAGDEITATLEAASDTWLLVESEDGETFFEEGMFTSDQSPLEIDLSGKERVFFKIGNASNLTITVNGVEMEYPVDANAKVRQDIWLEINQETE